MSARHILVGDEATANDIITKIKKAKILINWQKPIPKKRTPTWVTSPNK